MNINNINNQMDSGLKKLSRSSGEAMKILKELETSAGNFCKVGLQLNHVCSDIANKGLSELIGKISSASNAFKEASSQSTVFSQNIEHLKEVTNTISEIESAFVAVNVVQEQIIAQTEKATGKLIEQQEKTKEVSSEFMQFKTKLDSFMGTIKDIITPLTTLFAITSTLSKALKVLKNKYVLLAIVIALAIENIKAAYSKFHQFRNIVDKIGISILRALLIPLAHLENSTGLVSKAIIPLIERFKNFFKVSTDVNNSNEDLAESTNELAQYQIIAEKSMLLFSNSLGKQNINLKKNIDTIGGVEQKISELRKKQKDASIEQAITLEKEIELWEDKLKLIKDTIKYNASNPPELKTLEPGKGINIWGVKGKPQQGPDLKKSNEELQKYSKNLTEVKSLTEKIWGEKSIVGEWADNATSGITKVQDILKEFSDMLKSKTLDGLQKTIGSVQAMGAFMSNLGGIVKGQASTWLNWGANILAVIAAAIPQMLALFGIQSSLAVAAQGKLAFPFNIIAMAATVAGITAAIAAIPKPKAMAQGGIAFGPTFAMVGEYAGASNNPEVIAPLNKLRSLIEPRHEYGTGQVEFKISGRELVGVMHKMNQVNQRTR